MAASPPRDVLSAAARYGRLVDRVARKYTNPVTGKRLTGTLLLLKLTKGENGFGDTGVSSAGARGYTQFMPGTRADYIRRYGIDPWKNADQAEHATALYLKNAGNIASYNPGMGSYTNYVLGQRLGPLHGLGGKAGKSAPASAARAASGAAGSSQGTQLGQDLGQNTGVVLSLLQSLQGLDKQPLSSSAPAPPSFAAHLALPKTFQAPASGGGGGQQTDISQLLSLIKTEGGALTGGGSGSGGSGGSSGGGGGGSAGPAVGGGAPMSAGRYPLGKRGKIIGTPFTGTHAKAFNVSGGSDNWQSENAVDIAIPVGTPVYAVANGVLGNTGSLGQGGRFAGLRTNLFSKGNAWYYAHMSKLAPGIRAGAHVKKGQLLGYSGSANGVAHLHFGQERGDPRKTIGG